LLALATVVWIKSQGVFTDDANGDAAAFLSIALQGLAHSSVPGNGICAKRAIDAIIAHAGSYGCSHHLGRMVGLAIHQLQKHACMTQPRQCNRYEMLSESLCFSVWIVLRALHWISKQAEGGTLGVQFFHVFLTHALAVSAWQISNGNASIVQPLTISAWHLCNG
jgi:hypothetical protein